MRALVFGCTLILCLTIFRLTESHIALSVYMSICIAAIVCNVATKSGREASVRILKNLSVGWTKEGN